MNQRMKREINKICNCSDSDTACLWYNMNRAFVTGGLNLKKLALLTTVLLCAGELCSYSFMPDDIPTAISAAYSMLADDSSVTETMTPTSKYVEAHNDAELAVSYDQTPNNELLKIDDLMSMTGEEIRIAYLLGEVFAKDLFLSSDIEYINSMLNELYLHYTEKFNRNYKYPKFEPAPDGVDLTNPFHLTTVRLFHMTRVLNIP